MSTRNVVNSIKRAIYDKQGNEVGFSMNASDLARAIEIAKGADVMKKEVNAISPILIDEIANLKIALQTLHSECEAIDRKRIKLEAELDSEAKKIAASYGIEKFLELNCKKFNLNKLKKSGKTAYEMRAILETYNNKFIPEIEALEVKYQLSDEEDGKLASYNARVFELNEKCSYARKLLNGTASSD
jgi:hypothetical protein